MQYAGLGSRLHHGLSGQYARRQEAISLFLLRLKEPLHWLHLTASVMQIVYTHCSVLFKQIGEQICEDRPGQKWMPGSVISIEIVWWCDGATVSVAVHFSSAMQKICHQKLSIVANSHDQTHENCSDGVATLQVKILVARRIIISPSQHCHTSHSPVSGEISQDFFIFGNVSGISGDQRKEGRDKFFKCRILRKKSVYDHHCTL